MAKRIRSEEFFTILLRPLEKLWWATMLCHWSVLRISSLEALWNMFSIKNGQLCSSWHYSAFFMRTHRSFSQISVQEDLCFSQAAGLIFILNTDSFNWSASFFVFPAIKLRTKEWPYFSNLAFSLCFAFFISFLGILFCVSFL